ncbi:hypothetical protein B4U80_08053 [Leptotrombidium deliense]|uniref:Uncharacterized protein n=1 Tax=Leptotrombidium deliense TaxID=299467 RepID=A0A443STN8_9ACAR|nr:hypothetical protein B4U80_08053 [Leptotrombidium deliense]
MNISPLFIATLLFALCCSTVDLYRKNCEVSIDEADKCAIKLMFEGDRNRFVPRSLADMDVHCRMATTNIKCVEKHSRCYSAFPRQIMGTAMSNLKRAFKKRCTREGKRVCIKDDNTSEPAHQEVDKWTFNMKYIVDKIENTQQIPAVCCAFHIFRENLLQTVAKLCENSTKDSSAKYIEKTISGAVNDFMEIGCNRYRSLKDCRTYLPEITKTLEENVSKGVPKQNTSAIFHFLRIAVQLE